MMDSRQGLGTGLRRLLELLDGDLEGHYARHLPGYRPRFTPVVKALAEGGSLTVSEIARASGVSQPAASQTVALMAAAGWVSSSRAANRREREVILTARAREALPWLEEQWAITAKAAEALEVELGLDLRGAIDKAIGALEQKSFIARIEAEAASTPGAAS